LKASFSLGSSFNNTIYLNNVINEKPWNGYVFDQYSDPNIRDVCPDMNVSANFSDNGKEGNYWGGYNGSDVNGDGIGDLPYTMKIVVLYHNTSQAEFVSGSDNFPLMTPVDIDTVSIQLPEWALEINPISFSLPDIKLLDISNPATITVISPCENQTYNETSLSLVFTLDKQVNWTGYDLDGKDNVTIAGNTTLTGLGTGNHNVTVYATDEAGNVGASETIHFTVTEQKPEPEPFPTTLVITASGASAVAIGIGVLVYFRRRKKLEATK
jgi:hypothetical protein